MGGGWGTRVLRAHSWPPRVDATTTPTTLTTHSAQGQHNITATPVK